MSWLGNFFGGVASSVAGGLIGSAFDSQDEQRQADISDSSWAYRQQNAHQLEVQDLKNAGLNPLLSSMNGNMASSANVSSSSGDKLNVVNAINSARQLRIEQENVDVQKTNAETAKYEAETNRLRQIKDASKTDSDIALNFANLDLTLKNIDLASAKTEREKQAIANDAKFLAGQLDLMQAQSQLTYGQLIEVNKKAELLANELKFQNNPEYQEFKALELRFNKAMEEGKLADAQKEGFQMLKSLGRYIDALNPFTSAGVRVGKGIGRLGGK